MKKYENGEQLHLHILAVIDEKTDFFFGKIKFYPHYFPWFADSKWLENCPTHACQNQVFQMKIIN